MCPSQSVVKYILDTFCVVSINILISCKLVLMGFFQYELTFMAARSEYEREFGPIRTTGDFWCASRRACDLKPLCDSYINPRSVIPDKKLRLGYFRRPLGSRKYSTTGHMTKYDSEEKATTAKRR